jgi:hypothetical protein
MLRTAEFIPNYRKQYGTPKAGTIRWFATESNVRIYFPEYAKDSKFRETHESFTLEGFTKK